MATLSVGGWFEKHRLGSTEGVVGIEVGMEVDVRTEIGLRLVVVSSFVH